METTSRIRRWVWPVLVALLCLTPTLTAQAAPAGETTSTTEHRDEALFIDAARPSGAYGMSDAKTPQDVWLGAGSRTIKLVVGGLIALIILRWLWRRRSVSYT